MASAEDRFDDLVAVFVGVKGITVLGTTRGFGKSALRIDGRIFAMLVRGRLVVKLPAARVDALVAKGQGVPFDANKGRPMREWLSVDPAATVRWPTLAKEAFGFVAGHPFG